MRRGEWPFVAGLAIAVGLFGAAHLAGAASDRVDGTVRSDAGKKLTGTLANARIDEVKGSSAVIVIGARRYTLAGTSHSPRVGEAWKVAVTASRSGKPMKASVRADALLNGSVARHIGVDPLRNGVYVVRLPWPAKAAGIPLALRFTIDDGSVSESFLYAIRVRPAHG